MAKRPTKAAAANPDAKKPTKARGSKSASGALGREVAPPPARAMHPPPLPLDEIVGQDHAAAILQRVLKSGRVHHAWIFHGPAGVGKFTTALAFAALLLDPTGRVASNGRFEVDPESEVGRLIRAGTHPDLHVVTKELAKFSDDSRIRDSKLITIPKDVVVTHLLEPVALAASVRNDALAAKVFIVDEAELLDRSPTNAPVQNALLKTLEEPPDRTVIILVTSAEDRLLATIRSRAQRVAFQELDHASMARWYERWAARRAEPLADEERDWLLSFAGGAPGAFQMAAEGGLFAWNLKLAPMLKRVTSGEYVAEMGPAMDALVKDWSERWVENHDNASKDAANKAGADWMFRLIGNALRSGLRTMTSGGAAMRAHAWADGIDRLRIAESQIDANVSALFAFDGLVTDLAAIFAGEPIEALW